MEFLIHPVAYFVDYLTPVINCLLPGICVGVALCRSSEPKLQKRQRLAKHFFGGWAYTPEV